MNNKIPLEDILATIDNWKLEASSSYNDGWVVNGYKEKLELLRQHLEIKEEPRLIT
mgnify:CR=1 FL=1|tara:strand:- start:2902 stop:3069 length:168 start_codon:yes stop_codon:yes gene_type:complete